MIPIQYNIRSIIVRRRTALATVLGIALVVFVFSASLMLAEGIRRTMGRSGSDDIAIVIRKGSESEMASGIDLSQIAVILSTHGVASRDGRPDGVGEMVGVLSLNKVGTTGVSNAQLRGVADDALAFRPQVRVTQGRAPRPGTDEAMVGQSVLGRFEGLVVGGSVEIRKNRRLQIVGAFSATGSSYESEIWAPIDVVQAAYGRQAGVSSVRVRLQSPAAFAAFERELEGNRALEVETMTEPEYYAKQSEGTSSFIQVIGFMIAFFFSLGAMIGAMITMYAAVAGRIREIGTLRALGFRRYQVLLSFLLEALLLSIVGGVVGIVLSLGLGFVRFPIVNFASWSEIIFTFEASPAILLSALVFAAAMGFLGGLFPAIRASRANVLDALRGNV